MFVLAIFLLVIAVVALVVSKSAKFADRGDEQTKKPNRIIKFAGFGVLAIALIFTGAASVFAQDVGQSSVLKDWTGNIVGYESTNGLHFKAPWVDTVVFDVRNQRVLYAGASGNQSDNTGGLADGAQITVQDKDGVTSNIDIALRYSLKPDSVVDIYSQYLNEENLKNKLIFNDVRSVVRSVPGAFNTLELLTKRDEVQKAIWSALELKWKDAGIIVEDVALQEVRAPKTVTESYAVAQQAQINVTTETSNLESQKVKAQQKVVNAQAESDANALLNASLTPGILQQRYLDTLKELAAAGNLVVVPEGFNGLVNVTKK